MTHTVTVVMNLGFDLGDQATSSELFSRQHELRDFTRRYFASRVASDLTPENEGRLRREIMDTLNTRYLNNARVRSITFQRLDVMETL
jgi:flagellar basal body-associated protein FliL